MKRISLCVVLILSCSCHRVAMDSPEAPGQHRLCKTMDEYLRRDPIEYRYGPPGYDYEFRGPLTTLQVEQETLDEISRRVDAGQGWQVPQVPFGRMSKRWIKFKEQYKPGDEWYFFRTNQRSWDNLAGSQGYLLLRGDKIVGTVVTLCQ